ncbi:hypothetical protein F4861DRAFT_549479 [Xylaria intraflava]|nr:hypothetical protein F4861DRAFT_549479 [Xylaria intraflava]
MEGHDNNHPMGPITRILLEQTQRQQLPQSHPLPTLSQSQQQSSTTQRPTAPRQYTTVGSVYNPQLQPLQPPVRRGRTVKTLFPYKSESPAGPSPLQYTPLQQNSDRAVSPIRLNPDALPSTITITHQERQILQKFGVVVPSIPPTLNMSGSLEEPASSDNDAIINSGTSGNPKAFTSAIARSDNGSDIADTKSISGMNFNSLTNLASYPNPMQRAAQKLLALHRPQPNPSTGLQFSDSYSAIFNAEAEAWLSPVDPSLDMPSVTKIRGAPAPLTAGPPGVRQFRPSTFDQETLQRVREFDDENPMMNPYHMRLRSGRGTEVLSLEGESVSSMPTARTLEDDDFGFDGGSKGNETSTVIDTLPPDEARAFYPEGLPLNFNSQTQQISSDWVLERLSYLERPSDLYSIQSQGEFWAMRSQHIDNLFYSGSNVFNKTFDMVISEHNHRSLTHIVGHTHKEASNTQGKVTNRPISVHDASITPTSEHAAPLLSMAFQAIINQPEISPYSTLPKFKQSLYPPYLTT